MLVQVVTESEERIHRILEAAADGFMEFTETGDIVACNNSAEKMFGLSKSVLVGKNVSV